ncbi:hypothetical protein WICMUC_005060 [Wickerhamomyces mucosus]|uniref:SWR1-complex protein 4 n=1 Tax=Wickerhamomyces mucosus TaxID=1378264 RepID=A0A9P8T8K7_9ASCO|nr:hypothetical protein WICMUC_005060 [Wickerhamomyces mucosus]
MSNDILDVLNLQSNNQSLQPKNKKQKLSDNDQKLSGINRELYQLLGENTPPILIKQNKFKDKSLDKVSPWYWSQFNNGSRKDGLRLWHWNKGSKESNANYKFEKYNGNNESNIPNFTQKDYEDFLQDDEDEGEWSYEETLYLFNLVKTYELKWIVIHDRYRDNVRTIEDLKQRFYQICQRILIHQNELNESNLNSNLISNLNFNKAKEIERKEYLNRLLARSPAEIAEEESLLIEAKKFEISAKKTIQERSQLLQLLDTPQANGPIQQYLTSQGLTQLYNSLMTTKVKRRQNEAVPENPLTVLNEKLKQDKLNQQKVIEEKKKPSNPLNSLLSKNLTIKQEEVFGLKTHSEKISPGVYLRSSKLTNFKPNVQNKVVGILGELNIGKKPVMATEKIVNKQDELLRAINNLLELKKQLDKLDAETKINR